MQTWLWANRHAPDVAALAPDATTDALATASPTHGLREAFFESNLRPLRSAWPWMDIESLGVATRPRMVALGYELIILAPTLPGSVGYVPAGDTVLDPALRVLMHHVDGRWLVASLGDEKPPVWASPSE